jgi:hypothetical protein
MTALAALTVAVALLAASASAADHCNVFPNCSTCIASPKCGWCSTPVAYKSGAKGFNCAGFGTNNQFVCNGVFSTEQCERGYKCNNQTFECELTAPGQGKPEPVCKAECTTTGKTFVCDNSTMQCVLAPAGKGKNMAECKEACHATHAPSHHHPSSPHPHSHHPSSHHPSSPHPHSEAPHSAAPHHSPAPTPAPLFKCNVTTLKCEHAAPGEGGSLEACNATCKETPHHTPTALVGLWRDFQIDNTADAHEDDIQFFANGTVANYSPKFGTVLCSVTSIGDKNLKMICPAATFLCLYAASPAQPETYEMLFARSATAMPASFPAAMKAGAAHTSVGLMQKCVDDGSCKFHFGPEARAPPSSLEALVGAAIDRAAADAAAPRLGSDACNAFAANCSYCIAHSDCGWCSTPVSYQNGEPGSRCAGLSGGHNNFQCHGTYRTESCEAGYICDQAKDTCHLGKPGQGIPSKAGCLAACKAKPGPPHTLLGHYRGLTTSSGYSYGVVKLVLNGTHFVFSGNGTSWGSSTANGTERQGAIAHHDGVLVFTFDSPPKGPGTPRAFNALYSHTQNELVAYMTVAWDWAAGGGVVPAPAGYKQPARAGLEMVLAKCASASCTW